MRYFGRFYKMLTSPDVLPTTSKADMYAAVSHCDWWDKNLVPELLDTSFFSGLDQLYIEHLFPSFQSFGSELGLDMQYDANKAPAIGDDDEDIEMDTSVEIVSLDWVDQFTRQYIPAVMKFVRSWAEIRKQQLTGIQETEALMLLPGKVEFQLIPQRRFKHTLPGASWHEEWICVPMLTPSFLNGMFGSLNDVEEAAITVSHGRLSVMELIC